VDWASALGTYPISSTANRAAPAIDFVLNMLVYYPLRIMPEKTARVMTERVVTGGMVDYISVSITKFEIFADYVKLSIGINK
jgi:hypothetical protein